MKYAIKHENIVTKQNSTCINLVRYGLIPFLPRLVQSHHVPVQIGVGGRQCCLSAFYNGTYSIQCPSIVVNAVLQKGFTICMVLLLKNAEECCIVLSEAELRKYLCSYKKIVTENPLDVTNKQFNKKKCDRYGRSESHINL